MARLGIRGEIMSIARLVACALAVAGALFAVLPAVAKPPLEAFGDQPTIRAMQISPDGARLAFINLTGGKEMLVLVDLATGKRTNLIDATNIKARSIRFINEDYVLLYGSKSLNARPSRDLAEMSGAFSVNLKTAKAEQLLPAGETGLLQSGVGDVLAVDKDGKHIYTDAFAASPGAGRGSNTAWVSFDLIKINLDTGLKTGPGVKGAKGTRAWITDSQGKPLARLDAGDVSLEREIFGYTDGKSKAIYSTADVLSEVSIAGVKEGGGAIMIVDRRDGSKFRALYEMSLADGKITGPVVSHPDADVEGVITDRSHVVKGVVFSGFKPRYEFFDKTLNADVAGVQKLFPDEAVAIASWSDDWSKILFLVQGGKFPSQYLMGDRAKGKMDVVAQLRVGLTEADVGQVAAIRYTARDKLPIPALITWPASVAEADRKKLPLIVMPHGGPEVHDRIEFDWLAQFFANEGYMVLQPQFRGSDGFGVDFRNAGHGQWGRAMQHDISDGLAALVASGWVDPARVCIVGWSYGGYAALAGATLTPELYKCAVSVAGVADLPEMLSWERRDGVKTPSYIYWRSRIGDPATDLDKIKAVSPAQQVANVRAPVLLIHGSQDTTVPIEQSTIMERALKQAGKQVKLVRITGDDHSLVTSENRRAALTEISAFLAQHLGPGAPRSAVAPAAAAPATAPATP
jgi:dipeptidyl aminopeptidase/acylaminoacyl peptidase